MNSVRKILAVPFGISQPEWLVKLGAKLIGTESELVLKSRNVVPTRLLSNGFKFVHSDILLAPDDLIQ